MTKTDPFNFVVVWFIFIGLLAVALTGVALWALVDLVNWVTSK